MNATTITAPLNRDAMAARLASDIVDGWYVNLGIGIPTRVADFVPQGREVIFQSENGVLGIGPAPAQSDVDPYLINAGKQPITLLTGGAYVHQADSFAMIRGGHLDLCVLGAFEVAENGDIANWATTAADAAPAVGGAMDLAAGTKRVWVVMEHLTKDGQPRLVRRCTYPLTAAGVVARVYTNLAVFDVTPEGFRLIDNLTGMSVDELQSKTDAKIVT